MPRCRKLSHAVQPGGLTSEHHEQIHSLAAKGWSAGRIAKRIEKHPSTVAWFMCREGLVAVKSRPDEGKVYLRGGRPVRQFGAEEDAFIQALSCQGFCTADIARLAGSRFGYRRRHAAISTRLNMLAARDEAA